MGSILMKTDDAFMNNRIFGPGNPYDCLREALQKYGHSLNTSDRGDESTCDKILVFDLNQRNINYTLDCIDKGRQKKLLLMLWEGPVVINDNWNLELHKYFDTILTWNDDFVDNRKYFKLYYPQTDPPYYGIELPFEQKKLITMIVANKMYPHPQQLYSERRRAISFFEENVPEAFDLYGYGWDYSVKSYRGTVSSKEEVFARYKFAVCYENTRHIRGYVTEKIFDCMRGGCVPVYWGADNITDYIPANTFIDRRNFSDYQELLNFLLSMDKDTYYQYIYNIAAYARSEQFKIISSQNFVQIMLPHLV